MRIGNAYNKEVSHSVILKIPSGISKRRIFRFSRVKNLRLPCLFPDALRVHLQAVPTSILPLNDQSKNFKSLSDSEVALFKNAIHQMIISCFKCICTWKNVKVLTYYLFESIQCKFASEVLAASNRFGGLPRRYGL